MITFLSGEYPPDIGGVGDYTARLRLELDQGGCASRVVTRRQVGRWDARSLQWLLRHGPRSGVLHIQYQAAAYDLLGDVCLVPLLLRPRRRLKIVTTFHDARVPYLFPKAGRLRRGALRLLARTSHAVLAADERDLHSLGGPSRRSHQVPIGSNVERAQVDSARSRLGLASDALVLVYFGLLNASKGLETLLDAVERLTAARLLLLGGGAGASDPTDRHTAHSIEGRLARLGRRVIRPGYLNGAELSAHLLAADVAVLPYVDGASPRRGSLLACAEHGLPIVSTQPVSQAVADAVLGVPAGDPSALAAAVLEIAHDSALAARLRAGSSALANRCTWASIADRHLTIYKSLEC